LQFSFYSPAGVLRRRIMSAPSQPTVLVVDDNPVCRDVLGILLRDSGFEVAEAANGRDALAQLRKGPAPSLIVLDLAMPAMDGPQFRQAQLRDPALADIPVVVLSGYGGPAAAGALGAAGYVSKPAPLDEVVRQVRRFCPCP
jgi:CheY-like chemotaxis protein